MPRIVRRCERGFVDPLSLFGLLFLVVTLAAITFVTANKNFSLNIAEKASIANDGDMSPEYDLSKVLPPAGTPAPPPPPPPPPTTPDTTTPTTGGYDYDTAVNSANNVPNTAGYDCKHLGGCGAGAGDISGYYKAPNGQYYAIGGTGNDPSTYQETPAKTTTAADDTPTPVNDRAVAIENKLAAMDCSYQGGKYQSGSGQCLVSSTSQTLEKTDEGFITNSTTYVRDINTGNIVDAKTTSYIAKTTTTTTQNQGNTVTTSLTSYINPDTGQYYTDSTGKAIINITGLSIIPPSAKKTGGQTCSDSSECGSGSCGYSGGSRAGASKSCQGNAPAAPVATVPLSDKRPVGANCTDTSECGGGSCAYSGGRYQSSKVCQKEVLPDNNYGSCNGDPTCNSVLTSIDRGMEAISFGGWSNYVDAYSPDKVKIAWQEAGYKSAKDCQDDMSAKYNNQQAPASCNTYQITKEQVTSSIKLGTTLTAEGAAVFYALPAALTAGGTAAAGGAGALQLAGAIGAPALTSLGAITTLTQTSTAVVAQIEDPLSKEANMQTVYAGLSWLNLGTADKLIKAFSATEKTVEAVNAINSARKLNNLVSVVNVGFDAPNAFSTCKEAGILTGSCGGSLAAVAADLGFGFLDYKQGQLGFGNPLTKVNENALISPLPDIPDINGARMVNANDLSQFDLLTKNQIAVFPDVIDINGTKFASAEQLNLVDQLAKNPIANTSTVVNNGTQLIFPDKNPAQDPNTNFNLTKTDPNEASALAIFDSANVTPDGGTVAQLLPSNLNSQIPNTPPRTETNLANAPNADLTAPKPVEPNTNVTNDVTKPLTGTTNTNTVDSPTTANQPSTIASFVDENIVKPAKLDDPNASVLDKAKGVVDALPDTGGAITIVKKINQIESEIANAFDPRKRLPIENKPSTKDLSQVQEESNNTFKEPEKPAAPELPTTKTEDVLPDPLRQTAIVEPKTPDTIINLAPKPLSERLFGEPKTVSTANLKQGDTITLFPGDSASGVITTGASRVPGLRDDQKYYWNTSDNPTVHELTADGITVKTDNGTTSVYISTDPSVPGGRTPYEIVITTGGNIPVTITRANPEPGILSPTGLAQLWDDNVVKPLDNLLFGNPLPKTLDTAKVTNDTFTNVVINEIDLQIANSEIIGPSKFPTQTGDALIGQIRADQANVLSKTGLHHPSLITENPDLYVERLQAIAKENGFEITALSANPTTAEIKNATAEVVIKLSDRYDTLISPDVLAYRVGLVTEDLNVLPASTVPHATPEQDIIIQKSASNPPTDAELEAIRIKNASLEDDIRLALYTDVIDPTTDLKLLNKSGGDQALNDALKGIPTGTPVTVVDLGLSGLKKVNDTFGHDVGDKLLIESARIIDSTVANMGLPGAKVVHIKGKEYRLILPGADEATAKRILDQVTTNIENARLQNLNSPDVRIYQNMGFDYGIVRWDGIEGTSEFAKRAADTRISSENVRKAQELEIALANPPRAPSLFEKLVKDDDGWLPWLRGKPTTVTPIEKEILGPSEIPTGNNLPSKITNDQASLLSDTGLPNPRLIVEDQQAYIDGLNKVIEDNGLTKITIPENPARTDLEIAGAHVERMMIEKFESFTPLSVIEYKSTLAVTDLKNFPLNTVPHLDPAVNDAVFRSASEELQLLQQRTLDLQTALNDARYKDPMTGLYNKAGGDKGMAEIIEAAKATNGKVTIIGIDVSGLGAINKRLGPEAGDQLLIMAADIFDHTPRRSSDIVFRVGDGPDAVKVIHSHGDEFAIILPGTDEVGAKKIFDRLYEELAARKLANPDNSILQELNFDAGIAHWDGTETAEQLVNRADEAMYVNKVARKNAQAATDKPSLLDNIFNGIKKIFSPTPKIPVVEIPKPEVPVPQANTELTNGANEIAKKYDYESVNIDDSKLTTRIDIASDGFQEGTTADVYRSDVNVNGITKPAAVKLFLTNHETTADVLKMAETEARNSQIAKAILGDDAVDFYGIVTTKDGRVGLATQLIENGSNNPVTQKTVDDLLRIQNKLLREGYYIKDFQFLREPDGGVKVFDFWLLNKINDQTSELEGFAKKYGVDISLVKQDPVKYISLESDKRGVIFLGPQRSAEGIATKNGFLLETPKYEYSPSVEIPPVIVTPSQPKPTIFGLEYNGFKNEDGKFTLWPFEKVRGPSSSIPTTDLNNIGNSENPINVTKEFDTLDNSTSGITKASPPKDETIIEDTGGVFSDSQTQSEADLKLPKTKSQALKDIDNSKISGIVPTLMTKNGDAVEIKSWIADGGMGSVFKGEYQGETVVVKVARYSETEKAISQEFDYINDIRNALIDAGKPGLAAHIINSKIPLVDSKGNIIGYMMNELTDTSLDTLIQEGFQGLTMQDIKDFREIAKILDDSGLPFGDLYPKNIAKDIDGTWVLYDPISPNAIAADEVIYRQLTKPGDSNLPTHIANKGENITYTKLGWLYEVPTGNVDALETMLKTFNIKPNDAPLPWANEYVNTSLDNISKIPSVKTTITSPYIVMGAFTGLVGVTYAYDKVSEYFGYDLVSDQTFTDLWNGFMDLFGPNKNTLPTEATSPLTNAVKPPHVNPAVIPASPAKTSEQILQEQILGITNRMHATTPEELAKLFASIGIKDAYVGSDGSLICGPLSLEILKRLGMYTGDVNLLYQFEPGTEWDKLLKAFPSDKFTITNTLAENHSIGDMKYWASNPLNVGDFLFLEVSGSSRGFDHMLVVDRIDAQGRAYSTTNHFTIVNGVTTYVVDQVLLYDPTNPENPDAMFNKWTDRSLLNVNGNTGSGGFLVIRALPSVINSVTGVKTTSATTDVSLSNDPGRALDAPPPGLTSKGDGQCQRINNTYCDGQRMYELYTWYKDQPNGWWNANGGDFTPADFLAMTLVAEATSTNPDPKLLRSISEATANQLWASSPEHKPYCTTPNCEAGIFNFIGDYMMSAGLRYNAILTNNGNPSQGTVQNLTSGQDIYDSLTANGMTL